MKILFFHLYYTQETSLFFTYFFLLNFLLLVQENIYVFVQCSCPPNKTVCLSSIFNGKRNHIVCKLPQGAKKNRFGNINRSESTNAQILFNAYFFSLQTLCNTIRKIYVTSETKAHYYIKVKVSSSYIYIKEIPKIHTM